MGILAGVQPQIRDVSKPVKIHPLDAWYLYFRDCETLLEQQAPSSAVFGRAD